MRILVASSKGGVGKSAVATQILAPWLSTRLKRKIDYIIYDEINGTFYEKKENDFFNVIVAKDPKQFSDAVMNSEDCVVDVGGNKDCEIAINELTSETNIFDTFDVYAIPMKSDLASTKAAERVWDLVKEKRRPGAKILWFLVGAEWHEELDYLKYDFINFIGDQAVDGYGYVKGGISGLLSKAEKTGDSDYITFPQCRVAAPVERLALPVWQVGHMPRREEEDEFNRLKYKKKTPQETAKMIALRHYLFTFEKAKQYCDEVLEPMFKELDEKIGKML